MDCGVGAPPGRSPSLSRRSRLILLVALAISGAYSAADAAPNLRYEAVLVVDPDVMAGRAGFFLELSLWNDGITPVTLVWGRARYRDLYRFAVRRDDGTLLPSADADPARPVAALEPGDLKWIGPGQAAEYMVGLGARMGPQGYPYSFREPGTYRIEPSFHAIAMALEPGAPGLPTVHSSVWEGIVVAEPVVVTVPRPPDPKGSPDFGSITITGEVVDAAGKPIPGARVNVSARLTGGGGPPVSVEYTETIDTQATDTQGRFASTRLPDDSPTFTVRCSHPRYAFSTTEVTLINAPPRKEYSARLVMDPGIVLRGTVVQADGKPLAGARVTAGEKEAYTDADGRFELAGVPGPGPARCHVWKRDYIWQDVEVAEAKAGTGEPKIALETAETTEAQAGTVEPKIVLASAEPLPYAGRAVFADGKPVAEASIQVYLNEGSGRRKFRTAADGRFADKLPRPGTFSGTAWIVAEGEEWIEKGRAAPQRWYAAVEPFSPGAAELTWVFENRGRIRAQVEPANGRAPDGGFKLSCRFSPPAGLVPRDMGDQMIALSPIPPEGGAAMFDTLAPGTYELRLSDPEGPQDEYWSTWVTLPGADGGMEAEVQIAPYGKDFGGFRARLSVPGATALPAGLRAHVRIPDRSSRVVEVRDGVLAAGALPVGKLELAIWAQGYDPLRRSVDIKGGEISDLGDIQLVPADATHGWVTGHVLFEDGTPALGAIVGEPFGGTRVGADGSFRTQLPAGAGVLEVGLGSIPLWPRSAVPGELRVMPENGVPWSLAREWHDTVPVPVDVAPGETAAREVVIDRSALGSVRAKWPGTLGNSVRLALAVVRNGQVFACVFGRPPGLKSAAMDSGDVTLGQVPCGDRLLTLTIWRGEGPTLAVAYCGYQRDSSGAQDTVFTFDPGAVGVLSGTMRRQNGDPARDDYAVLLAEPITTMVRNDFVANAPIQADGTFRFSCVAPGRYLVKRASPEAGGTQAVEIRQGAEATVELHAP